MRKQLKRMLTSAGQRVDKAMDRAIDGIVAFLEDPAVKTIFATVGAMTVLSGLMVSIINIVRAITA